MQKISVLYDAGQAVLSTFDPDEVMDLILGIVHNVFRLQSGGILLLDRSDETLFIRSGFGDMHPDEMKLPVGVGITGTAARLKRPIYAPDVSKDPRYVGVIEGTASELAIPLMVRDEVVGVLDCQSSEIAHFDNETMDLLTLFATQASIGLQNAQLYSQVKRRAVHLEAINAISKQTTAVHDIGELLKQFCSLLLQSFPMDQVSVFLYDEDESLILRAQEGTLTPLVREGDTLPPAAASPLRAVTIARTVLDEDVATLASPMHCYKETRSEVSMPLVSFGETIGLLACHSAAKEAFQVNDVKALESVADIISSAIKNARYVERVKQLAYLDGLTGIANRRFFDSRIQEELERASRYSGQLSVLMIDIDHFKEVNDEYGHMLGDEVLRQVASIFKLQLRKGDAICRYGGEEFAIVAPATSGENAMVVADKLRRVVEGWQFPGVPRSITISVGVAEYPDQGTTRDALVRAADAALYLAKQRGRNRVQSAKVTDFSAISD